MDCPGCSLSYHDSELEFSSNCHVPVEGEFTSGSNSDEETHLGTQILDYGPLKRVQSRRGRSTNSTNGDHNRHQGDSAARTRSSVQPRVSQLSQSGQREGASSVRVFRNPIPYGTQLFSTANQGQQSRFRVHEVHRNLERFNVEDITAVDPPTSSN